jgi:hypothetical protein
MRFGEAGIQMMSRPKMMSRLKKIWLGSLVVFIAVQFIQPARNKSGQVLYTDISKVVSVPENVRAILQNACYDCHSNNTVYPWYSYIQPAGWWMNAHIKEGKEDLNFSEFGSYSLRRRASKLHAIENSITDGSMPLWSYTLLHKKARLTKEDKTLLISWVQKVK